MATYLMIPERLWEDVNLVEGDSLRSAVEGSDVNIVLGSEVKVVRVLAEPRTVTLKTETVTRLEIT